MGNILAFDQVERSRRVNGSAAAKAGRKKIAQWLDHIEGLRKQRLLLPVYCVVARGLTNFPSATLSGYVWASQPTLAASIAVSPRTISRAINSLKTEAALIVIQRGNGRSARYVFCIDGMPVNDAALTPGKLAAQRVGMPRNVTVTQCDAAAATVTQCDAAAANNTKTSAASTPMARLASTPMARLDGAASPRMAMESCDSSESNEHESPPNPLIIINADADEISFETLWRSVRGERGHTGPAITAWSKLNRADRLKIGNLIGPSGLELDGMWLSTWLTQRRFDAAPLSRKRSFDEKIEAPQCSATCGCVSRRKRSGGRHDFEKSAAWQRFVACARSCVTGCRRTEEFYSTPEGGMTALNVIRKSDALYVSADTAWCNEAGELVSRRSQLIVCSNQRALIWASARGEFVEKVAKDIRFEFSSFDEMTDGLPALLPAIAKDHGESLSRDNMIYIADFGVMIFGWSDRRNIGDFYVCYADGLRTSVPPLILPPVKDAEKETVDFLTDFESDPERQAMGLLSLQRRRLCGKSDRNYAMKHRVGCEFELAKIDAYGVTKRTIARMFDVDGRIISPETDIQVLGLND
jgi:hypothetical protein